MKKIITFFISVLLLFLFIELDHYKTEQCKIVKEYFDSTYKADSIVRQDYFTHNEYGFTGGVFQYGFTVTDKVSGNKYHVRYYEYSCLTKETVNRIKITEKE